MAAAGGGGGVNMRKYEAHLVTGHRATEVGGGVASTAPGPPSLGILNYGLFNHLGTE